MRANNETTNIYDLYGSSKSKLLAITSSIAALSLAGIVPLSGFFGKAAIGTASLYANLLVYAVLAVIGFASSVYIFRWLIVPMRRAPEGEETQISSKYAHLPRSMLASPAILAVLVIAAALLYLYLPGYLAQHMQGIGVLDAATESGIAVAGILVAYMLFRKVEPLAPSRHRIAVSALYNSLLVNKAYMFIANLFYAIGAGIDAIDNGLYEAALSGGNGVVYAGGKLRRIVNGQPNVYLVAVLIGIILLVAVMVV
jgi:NADH:ubiquinone oxidoreductase subunit 5 (subunit L)/multisubunit Na+/H+ antiporter MnhA subunit